MKYTYKTTMTVRTALTINGRKKGETPCDKTGTRTIARLDG